jgi:hypothetical protein
LKRKLVLLNVALVALIGAACWQLRVAWLAAKQHEKEVLVTAKPKPAAALPYTPPQAPPPVVPVQYLDVANKNLFSRDRNPVVIIEPPKVEPPPPPKPMPALPVVKGILNIEGVTAIMTEAGKTVQKEIKPGDQIGEFKLLAINNQEIVLEWDGKEVRRPVQELFDRSIPEPTPAAAGPAPAPAAPKPQIQQQSGPGQDIGAGRKACVPGDTTAVGTVVDGLKKITWDTPFGKGCAWEAPK